MNCFDIRPFALPNTAANEIRFEDPRDVTRVVVTYADSAPDTVTLSYLRKTWPGSRIETMDPAGYSHGTGWIGIDDWWNSKWEEAAVAVERIDGKTLSISFKGLHSELPDITDYDVTFRRTLGVKVDSADGRLPDRVEVYTTSKCAESELRIAVNSAKGQRIKLSAYNAVIAKVSGATADGMSITLPATGKFRLVVKYLTPSHPFSYDEGLVTFELGDDAFTISLESLAKQGPIWFEDQGTFVTFADDPTTLDQYLARNAKEKTTLQKVTERQEQSYSGAMNGQPRPQPCACTVGCKHARQRFWLEPNGDILTMGINLRWVPGPDTDRSKFGTNGRLMFDLGNWRLAGRYFDPAPSMVYNTRLMNDDIMLEQRTFGAPLHKSIFDDILGDDTIICLSRFTLTNTGDSPVVAQLPISYTANSDRSYNRPEGRDLMTDQLVPHFKAEKLSVSDLGVVDVSGPALRAVRGEWEGQSVLRCAIASPMEALQHGDGILLRKELAPGESCEVLLKVPHIDLDRPGEIAALAALDYEKSSVDVRKFWREECANGAHLKSGEPNLDALYKSHIAHVELTDSRMCSDPSLINTSVGSSTYGNYPNESIMIIEELDERGLHDQARQRIGVWLKFQSTVGLIGLFTDHEGVFYGADGYESGQSYDQHHGWVLWYIAKHYFFTGDAEWMRSVADQLIKGVDWVARQRKETEKDLVHSRGWEKGFLAAGALEDVEDFFYWLSTNTLTWRGVEWAARALKAISHPEATHVQAEADYYKKALLRGFEIMRQQSPLVRLKDGRWIPHYPSRLYRRGRDIGWIREVLEGSVYLLISGLYDSGSKQAQWILDDFLDNRYMHPYYSYPVIMPERSWVDYGGFSNQPNLLAGLMPHLERDETEVYIWMFFNAWASCYREEVNAMVEHPQPILGFSNSAIYKTSDQANAIKWLRYMYVYATDDLLHLGRAIPRQWLRDGNEPYAEDVITCYGKVGVRYAPEIASGRITATIDLENRSEPAKTLVRFRHPDKLPVKSVTVNGKGHSRFDAEKGDVDITGLGGRVVVVAAY